MLSSRSWLSWNSNVIKRCGTLSNTLDKKEGKKEDYHTQIQ